MHPARSIILFTVTAGAGYGLLLFYALLILAGVLPLDHDFGAVVLFIALGLQAVGLVSSTFHLKHPERAWRAFSQWRSSWLSREGVASILTFIPAGLWFLALVFGVSLGGWAILFAVLSVLGALTVVSCTAMVYGSLRTIRQWHHRLVLPAFHLLAAQTGTLLLLSIALAFGYTGRTLWIIAILACAAAWMVKLRYWRSIDQEASASTPATATGLDGRVRLADPPHTEMNYLLTEMGYRVARKHAAKLRQLAFFGGAILPILAIVAASSAPPVLHLPLVVVGTVLAFIGVALERWLFFAQATHTLTLYYGAQAA